MFIVTTIKPVEKATENKADFLFNGYKLIELETSRIFYVLSFEKKLSIIEYDWRKKLLMNILIVTQFFPPDFGPPSFRMSAFAEALLSKGHRVTVLSAEPNRYEGKIDTEYLLERENFSVIRLPFPKSKSNLWKKLRYMTFSRKLQNTISNLSKGFDVLLCTSPPLTIPLAVAKAKIQKPIIVDIRDIWPKTLKSIGVIKNKLEYSFLKKCEEKVYNSASHIICTSPAYLDYLAKYKPTTLVMNGIDSEWYEKAINTSQYEIQKARYEMCPSMNCKLIVYSGNIGTAQNLEFVIEAAKKLDNSNVFCFIGDGNEKEKLKKLIRKNRVNEKIKMLPLMNRLDTVKYLKAADYLLVNLINNKEHTEAVPSKIFEYMVIGKPIIAGLLGAAKEILKKSGCDVEFIKPSSSRELIEYLRKNRKYSGDLKSNYELKEIYKKFSRINQTEKLIKIVEKIVS